MEIYNMSLLILAYMCHYTYATSILATPIINSMLHLTAVLLAPIYPSRPGEPGASATLAQH